MKVVDLTMIMPASNRAGQTVETSERLLTFANGSYRAVEHRFAFTSTDGTYIDFPGHIKEADDGLRSENCPLEKLYRVKSAVIRLDRESGSGAVSADDLAAAAPDLRGCGGMVINALGRRRFDQISNRSVWLTPDAGEWIVSTGIYLFVSDIYERDPGLTGIFAILFKGGVSTICCPGHLHMLTSPHVLLTALPPRFGGGTQVPCRVVAEF